MIKSIRKIHLPRKYVIKLNKTVSARQLGEFIPIDDFSTQPGGYCAEKFKSDIHTSLEIN